MLFLDKAINPLIYVEPSVTLHFLLQFTHLLPPSLMYCDFIHLGVKTWSADQKAW